MTGRPLTPDEIAALAALPVTPGSWWPSRHNGPNDVDRGKIWAFRAGPPPVQMIVVAEVNRFIGTEADQRLAAASPDLLATAQHLLQQRDDAWSEPCVVVWNQAQADAMLAYQWFTGPDALTLAHRYADMKNGNWSEVFVLRAERRAADAAAISAGWRLV